MTGTLEAVGALIKDDRNRVYVHRRAAGRRLFPGIWDIVGGHVEPGESAQEALAREIEEETGWRLRRILTVPYWIIGGWAIDLAVGRVTRDHADVDVMLLERDKHALWNDLPVADVQIAGHGRRLTVHSKNLPLPTEVFLAQADGAFWVHRRGPYRVTRPLAGLTRIRDGIPFLPPG